MSTYSNTSSVQGPFKPNITVVGVGGAGGNAVNNMIASKLDGVSFLTTNTDAQALENSLSSEKIQLGSVSTGGLGAGARPEIGRAAAEESLDEVMSMLDDQNMVFITAGMGGGTGTGAAPVIAKACKEKGILTVGVVTKPFQFEGAQRMRLADAGIDEMAQYVDTLIVIPNQNLFRIANEKTTFADAFRMADEVLQAGVKGVTDLMVVPGMINLDFADVRSATSEMGKAMMGSGEASGDRRAIEAAEQAINNPLLDDVSMKGARSVIINISGGHDMTLFEIEEASNRITDEVDPDATIIFGSTFDDSLEGSIRVTVVATGIEAEINRRAQTRPLRASNTVAQPQQVRQEEPQTHVADSFTTRYPEPSRVSQTTQVAASSAATSTVAPTVPTEAAPQQAAVASLEPQVTTPIETVTPTLDTGTIETDYVTDGSALRKVEVKNEQSPLTSDNNSVIPPYAPAHNQGASEGSSLSLNPPMRNHNNASLATPQKKTPSLFERITGRTRGDDVTIESDNVSDETTSGTGSADQMTSGLNTNRQTLATTYDTPSVNTPTQGQLNIEAPSIQPKNNISASSEDLDIPAFLRRQIS